MSDLLLNDSTNSPFTIFGARQYQFISKLNREYRIFISAPNEEPPPSGFPVIYLLDGNSIFATVVEAIRIQSRRPEKTGILPAIVVGIGYPTDSPFSSERYLDYTLGNCELDIPIKTDGGSLPKHGGAAEFLSFIEEELKPAIHHKYKIDQKMQTLFGHSLGGLFVLNTLFTSPASFQTYIAGSPSIHWNKTIILEKERNFVSDLENSGILANLLVGVGELEKWHHTNTGELAREMAERLYAYKKQGLNVTYMNFEGEGHVSVLLPLINKSLQFSFHDQVVRS